jgi:hypothetical protein
MNTKFKSPETLSKESMAGIIGGCSYIKSKH